jgi:hypothetical protein
VRSGSKQALEGLPPKSRNYFRTTRPAGTLSPRGDEAGTAERRYDEGIVATRTYQVETGKGGARRLLVTLKLSGGLTSKKMPVRRVYRPNDTRPGRFAWRPYDRLLRPSSFSLS